MDAPWCANLYLSEQVLFKQILNKNRFVVTFPTSYKYNILYYVDMYLDKVLEQDTSLNSQNPSLLRSHTLLLRGCVK